MDRGGQMLFSGSIRWAFAALVGVLVLSSIAFRASVAALNVYLRKEPVALRESFDTIPTKLGRWRRVGQDGRMGDAMVESLGTNQYLDRHYALDGDPSKGVLLLHIAYYTGMVDAVPHVPERCWGAAGMLMVEQPHEVHVPVDRAAWDLQSGPLHPVSGERYPVARVLDPVTRAESTVHMPLGETDFSVTVFQEESKAGVRFVGGYLFVANGRMTSSPYVVRTYAFDLANRHAYYCKIQFSMVVNDADGAEGRWVSATADLLGQVLPAVMKCLPDWPEVEQMELKES